MEYSVNELADKLRNAYENAAGRDKAVAIHLFGIKYGGVIRDKGVRIADIVGYAGLNNSYVTELNKGVKLSKYVEIKPGVQI